ncbi:MAG: hypothetical protein P1V97_23640, partial [Planctomycetota bacterium]|nr:hypothetical protein [Planctomycetota bacterium]
MRVPENPPTGALLDEASDGPTKLDKSVALKSGRLVECVKCGTVVWNATKSKGNGKLHCPDCRAQQPFSESKLHVVKGDLPNVVENPQRARASSFPGFFAGIILGALLAIGVAVYGGLLVRPGNKDKTPDPFVS